MLTAATTDSPGFNFSAGAVLLALIVIAAALFIWARPRLKAQRRRSWEKAGLLPEQLDPEGHRHAQQSAADRDGTEGTGARR
ncbi:hypothetical protein ACMYYO_11695 [Dermacoccaceae bacterium W4C1]